MSPRCRRCASPRAASSKTAPVSCTPPTGSSASSSSSRRAQGGSHRELPRGVGGADGGEVGPHLGALHGTIQGDRDGGRRVAAAGPHEGERGGDEDDLAQTGE